MGSEHFEVREVAAGIWAAVGDLTRASVGNATIIDLGGKTVVVDTFMSDVAAADLRALAEQLTGNKVYLAVNTHWHGDHTYGNQVFADVPIVSTRTTLDRLMEEDPAEMLAWQAEIERSIDTLRDAAAGGDAGAAARINTLQHFHRFTGNYRLTLPDLIIDDRLVVEGERAIEITSHGRGHTVSDIIVWIPDDRILVSGDLCWTGIHPRTQDGFPTDWADYAERLIALDPVHVIPGHGEPADATALAPLPAYFRTVADLVVEVAAGADPAEIDAPAGTESWAGLERFRTGLRVLAAG